MLTPASRFFTQKEGSIQLFQLKINEFFEKILVYLGKAVFTPPCFRFHPIRGEVLPVGLDLPHSAHQS